MHLLKEDLPVTMEAPDTKMRTQYGWGGMAIAYNEVPAGMDVTPLLKGLHNDSCHCPHWGYLVKGSIHMRYDNGKEEVIKAGEVFYLPPGHTAWTDEPTALIDISPEKEFKEVMDHIQKKMEEMSDA